MASAALKTRYTPAQHLALERKADYKSEYVDGFITAMSGTSREHNRIALSFASKLNDQLADRDCEAYMSDLRVRVRQIPD